MTSLDTKISEVNYTLPEKCVDLKVDIIFNLRIL